MAISKQMKNAFLTPNLTLVKKCICRSGFGMFTDIALPREICTRLPSCMITPRTFKCRLSLDCSKIFLAFIIGFELIQELKQILTLIYVHKLLHLLTTEIRDYLLTSKN